MVCLSDWLLLTNHLLLILYMEIAEVGQTVSNIFVFCSPNIFVWWNVFASSLICSTRADWGWWWSLMRGTLFLSQYQFWTPAQPARQQAWPGTTSTSINWNRNNWLNSVLQHQSISIQFRNHHLNYTSRIQLKLLPSQCATTQANRILVILEQVFIRNRITIIFMDPGYQHWLLNTDPRKIL